MPDRLGDDDDAVRSGPRAVPSAAGTFLRDSDGRRPVYGGTKLFQEDPHWRDLILFYEYFHGDNGAGLGASHQTGWTGLVARLIQSLGQIDAGRRSRTITGRSPGHTAVSPSAPPPTSAKRARELAIASATRRARSCPSLRSERRDQAGGDWRPMVASRPIA